MKQKGILNPQLIAELARLGHTECFVIADAGLPLPQHVPVIDLSLVRGIPSFLETFMAICAELVVERCIMAEEICAKNPATYAAVCRQMGQTPIDLVSHVQLKTLLLQAKAIVRTGEATPYANCILVGGVNF